MFYLLTDDNNIQPCSGIEWSQHLRKMPNKDRHIAEYNVDGYYISTLWLGLDHGWGATQEPLLFETMIFDKNGESIYQKLCSEAQKGHQEAIKWLLEEIKNNLTE